MRGADKMLEPVRGAPLLRDRAKMCLASGVDHVRVVVRPDAPARLAALEGLDLEICETNGAENGLSHSIQVGIDGLEVEAALFVLADLPELTAAHLDRVLDAAKAHSLKHIIRGATERGKPGHPVLIRNSLFNEFNDLSGDTGAQPILKRHARDTVLVPLGDAVLADLDTPEAWAEWRAEQ